MSAAEQLLNALKETLRSTSKPKRFVADVALVLAAFGQLEQALGDVQQRWGRLRGTLGERAHEAEQAASLARTLLSRARDLRAGVAAARDAVEGVRLVALNAGLEGARQQDAGGAALVRLSDDVRGRSVQAAESLEELATFLEQLDRDQEQLRDATTRIAQELETFRQPADDRSGDDLGLSRARESLEALGSAIERATGTDPELAPLLAAAAEHARGLASALSQLGSREGARLALRSLQPLLEPLITVLGDIYGSGRESPGRNGPGRG